MHKFTYSKRGSASVDFDTTNFINRVTVWDHALCLDIDHINIETEAATHPYVGSNENIDSFVQKLKYIETWLTDQKRDDV